MNFHTIGNRQGKYIWFGVEYEYQTKYSCYFSTLKYKWECPWCSEKYSKRPKMTGGIDDLLHPHLDGSGKYRKLVDFDKKLTEREKYREKAYQELEKLKKASSNNEIGPDLFHCSKKCCHDNPDGKKDEAALREELNQIVREWCKDYPTMEKQVGEHIKQCKEEFYTKKP